MYIAEKIYGVLQKFLLSIDAIQKNKMIHNQLTRNEFISYYF